jgi:hypothetical protein
MPEEDAESTIDPKRSRLLKGFNSILDSHGYGFHYAVLNKANELFERRKSAWAFEAAEFPVVVNDVPTRIDFVLSNNEKGSRLNAFYLVAECKRANPSLADWCFARAPFVRRNRSHEPCILDHVDVNESGSVQCHGAAYSQLANAYHIAVEVKSGKGDESGKGRGAIEDAATQVCRGSNGFLDTLARLFTLPNYRLRADLLPVIFTTAHLWTTDADLRKSDLDSGKIDLATSGFDRVSRLILQYHTSPGIKSFYIVNNRVDDLSKYLDDVFVRSIGVVSSTGIEEFLNWASAFDRG